MRAFNVMPDLATGTRNLCHTAGLRQSDPAVEERPMKNYFNRTSQRVLAIIVFWVLIALVLWLSGLWR